ncbi:hypothetical protein RB2150_14631 [Rhodobacteraceae bacterium HTCC2150]|nr:hypothetical protein RB2150_14631 [Rhodobacteraceae bacterium HTCC2150]
MWTDIKMKPIDVPHMFGRDCRDAVLIGFVV